jgi:hypothetical protein
MALVYAEACRSGNYCMIFYTNCSAQNLFTKVMLQNMVHGTCEMKTMLRCAAGKLHVHILQFRLKNRP